MENDDGYGIAGIGQTFSAVQTLLLSTDDIESFLDELATLACDAVEPSASSGITMRWDDQPLTVASSDVRARQLDQTQYENADGPCLQSLKTGQTIDVPDFDAEQRWPEFRARALDAGVRCSLSLPLTVNDTTVGALNMYGFDRTHEFEGEQRQRLELFAAQAATAVTVRMRQIEQTDLVHHLEEALASRSTIDQALGVLMGQQRCSADEAFGLLRAHSQNTNTKLRDVAKELVTRVTGKPPENPPVFRRNGDAPRK